MNKSIGIYVQGHHAKATYKRECYDIRRFAGLEMLRDVLVRAGYDVGYASAATVRRFAIILVSITAGCDWWPFIAERLQWGDCRGITVIVGGPGVLNVRPFLPWFDIAVFGRAENIILPLVQASLKGDHYAHPSVCYSDSFTPQSRYTINQSQSVYPHTIQTAVSMATPDDICSFTEHSIGCRRKCLFCGYTWHRRFTSVDSESYTSGGAKEYTMLDLDMTRPETWASVGQLRNIGLDGMSERLRRQVKKPISRQIVRSFLSGLPSTGMKPHQIKFYNIVGYPEETDDDWQEHIEDLRLADESMPDGNGKQWSILLHSTPFRAMPATPCRLWQMSYRNYRGQISKRLKQYRMPGNVYFQGQNLWAVESMGTDSLPTVALDALVWRGTEDHVDVVEKLARSRKFWSAPMAQRLATLEAYIDTGTLFREQSLNSLATSYLCSYLPIVDREVYYD